MAWEFGISEVTTWPWTFEQDVERYVELGAGAIEVWEMKLDPDPARRRNQLHEAQQHGLVVSSFQANVHALFPTHLAPEPAAFEQRRGCFVETLEAYAPVIPGAVFVLNTGVAADGDVEAAFAKTVVGYRELARRANDLGVRLALEPLHPLAMNEDSYIWNVEDARALVQAVGEPALGICADAWNLAGQYDLDSRLSACRGLIMLAQLADYRRPRSFLDRLPLGDGSLDFTPFLDGLRRAEYEGPLVLEIFSKDVPDSIYDGDLAAVVARSRRTLERLMAPAAPSPPG